MMMRCGKKQAMLKAAMDELELDYFEAEGEAAFYGPKLDVQVKTALGMEETLSTIQLDFLLPERFDLTYVGEDGENTSPSCYPPWYCLNNGTICGLLNRSLQRRFPYLVSTNSSNYYPSFCRSAF